MNREKITRESLARCVYAHTTNKGCRLPGWEDVSITALAAKMGKSAQHIRQVLTGRRDCTLGLLEDVAANLSMSMETLVGRIRAARELDKLRVMELNRLRLLTEIKARNKRREELLGNGPIFAGPRGKTGGVSIR